MIFAICDWIPILLWSGLLHSFVDDGNPRIPRGLEQMLQDCRGEVNEFKTHFTAILLLLRFQLHKKNPSATSLESNSHDNVKQAVRVATRYASAPCKLTISLHLFARWHLFRHAGYLRHQQQKLTFDLLTLKVVSESHVTRPTSVPILVFLGRSLFSS